MNEFNRENSEPYEKNVTRRSLLGFALAAGAAAVLGADKAPHPDYYPDYLKKLPEKPINYATPEKFPQLTKQYIDQLFQDLQRSVGSEVERQQAVRDSLRTIRTADKSNGTALQLDESGIFLTASHVVLDEDGRQRSGITINDPRDGVTNPARQLFVHEVADLAIIYAPTGHEPGAVPGLEIDAAMVADNERLQVVGKWPPENYLFIDSGQAKTKHMQETWFPVEDMIPFGGTSGSPVVDADGKLRGVLVGSYGTGHNIEEYAGARVEPIRLIGSLPEHGNIL